MGSLFYEGARNTKCTEVIGRQISKAGFQKLGADSGEGNIKGI
jgi:hypothetical protein